jgi:hypothetical protein
VTAEECMATGGLSRDEPMHAHVRSNERMRGTQGQPMHAKPAVWRKVTHHQKNWTSNNASLEELVIGK